MARRPCAALAARVLRREALRPHHLADARLRSAVTTPLLMHVRKEAFKLSQAAFCGCAFNQHRRQSVLLRVHTSPLSPASALTARRVSGKWPWPPLWPANQPFGAQVPGCERRITVVGLVGRRSAFLRPGSGTPPSDLRLDSNTRTGVHGHLLQAHTSFDTFSQLQCLSTALTEPDRLHLLLKRGT